MQAKPTKNQIKKKKDHLALQSLLRHCNAAVKMQEEEATKWSSDIIISDIEFKSNVKQIRENHFLTSNSTLTRVLSLWHGNVFPYWVK